MRSLTQKFCFDCGEWKDKSEFHKNKSKKDGLVSSCKKCVSGKLKKYYQDNTESVKEKVRQYRLANPLKVAEYLKKRYKANVDKLKKYKQSWYKANKEKHNRMSREWRKANPDRDREIKRQWLDRHPGKLYEYTRTRRALKKGSGGRITKDQWEALKEFYGYTCLCCGRKEPEIELELDHVQALAGGGKNEIQNAQCLCVTCNRSKATKHIDYRPIIFYG